MTRPFRPPPRPKHTSEQTAKLRFCRGCHNEIHPDVVICLVCGTENPLGTPGRGAPVKKDE